MLTKSSCLLDQYEIDEISSSVRFWDNDDTSHLVTFPLRDWEDMGRPEQITLTIRPGNALGTGEV